MIHYEPVKVTINTLRLAKIILDMVVWHYGYNRLNLITTTRLRGGMLSVNGRSHVLRHVIGHVTQKIVESWKGAQSRELR